MSNADLIAEARAWALEEAHCIDGAQHVDALADALEQAEERLASGQVPEEWLAHHEEVRNRAEEAEEREREVRESWAQSVRAEVALKKDYHAQVARAHAAEEIERTLREALERIAAAYRIDYSDYPEMEGEVRGIARAALERKP